MDFVRLFGAVIAVLFHPGSASKRNGKRICRRGTERPCYKVSYMQDSRWRLNFEDASQACRLDGGELLSIETEGEQRLVERFIQDLQAGDGDFWIGLRRSPGHFRAETRSPGCPSQYYWLDGSKAKFRNWHWDEPSCGGEMCVVLYYQPSAPRDEEGHFLFQWNDHNCNAKNNYVCKYAEEKLPTFAEERNTVHAVSSLRPNILSTTESDEMIRIGLPESSHSTLYISYILYASIPVLLLLLFAAAGFFCYKHHVKRLTQLHASRSSQCMSTAAAVPCAIQGPYAFSDITKLSHATPDSSAAADISSKYPCTSSQGLQCDDYENVSCLVRESGFVTNDIYETCKTQSRRCHNQTGWVENDIYG
ncbi:layilin isoform X2 [Thalassophryne amazonica]|uniref:layilin isoform X2 n=1 Tax=Thalassophryne amazonica TaxID=390379 RepID=UPI0014709603|nr:layilin isoform X2 [Thalassophryne amazonica]